MNKRSSKLIEESSNNGQKFSAPFSLQTMIPLNPTSSKGPPRKLSNATTPIAYGASLSQNTNTSQHFVMSTQAPSSFMTHSPQSQYSTISNAANITQQHTFANYYASPPGIFINYCTKEKILNILKTF